MLIPHFAATAPVKLVVRAMQAAEAGHAAKDAREEVIELQMAAQAKDRENAKLWDQACCMLLLCFRASQCNSCLL